VTYDYIIVGGGSAGSVLANRLSARSANKVLLCEAGQDTPHGKVPEAILDSYPGTAAIDERFQWAGLKVRSEVVSHNAPPEELRPPLREYVQARVLGGGSSINGQLANRGSPDDYDEWERRGATGWSWEDVLPFFKRIERDMDFDGPYHGERGRIPVRRIFPDLWTEHAKAMGDAFAAAGYEFIPDQNGEYKDGYFPIPISNLYERRVSAAIGYLDPGVRLRKNLTISTDTVVKGLIVEGAVCIGVNALVNGKEVEFWGNEIILSSGALNSPAHLLRAGIGPAMALRAVGVDVVSDVPGVGQGLQDHPSIALASFLRPSARMNEFTRRHIQVGLRYSSGFDEVPGGDMFVAVASKSAWHAVGNQIGSMLLCVYKTYSETGQVKLASRDWRDQPIVEFNLLSDRRDLDRLMQGFRMLARLHEHPAMQAVSSDSFPAVWGEKVRQAGTVTPKNKLMTDIAAKLLDGPDGLRRWLMDRFVRDEFTTAQLLTDDGALEAFVRQAAIGVWHASCTCRMGATEDPMSVTDAAGRVRGVQGLRVCDASVFPVVPCANTNFPTLMTAEKIAQSIMDGN